MSGDEDALPPRRSDEAIAAAVAADPDAAPVRSAVELAAVRAGELARDVHGVMRLRRRLGIAQVVFAQRYGIPLTTLRNWEQGRAEPDRSAKVLLAAIAADPEGVARAARHAGDPAFLANGGLAA
jgi:putative transcriptional regulator